MLQMNVTERIGVVVVHGIGDPEPGAALHDLTDSLASTGVGLVVVDPSRDRVQRLIEDEDQPVPESPCSHALLKYFPMHVREGWLNTRKKQEVVFAEVFWGSASQLPGGWWGVMLGLAKLIGGMAWVMDGAVPPSPKHADRHFNHFARYGSYLIVGPIAAAHTLAFIGMILYATAHRFWGFQADDTRLAAWIVVITMALSVGAGALILAFAKEKGGSLITRLEEPSPDPRSIYGASLVISCLAGLPVLLATAGERNLVDYSRWTAAALVLLLSLNWAVLLIILLWHSFLCVRHPRVKATWRTATLLALAIQYSLWFFLIPTGWSVLFDRLEDTARPFGDVYLEATPGEGMQWLLGFLMIAIVLMTVVWRRRVVIRQAGKGRDADPAPRLLVNRIITISLFTIVGMGSLGLLLHSIGRIWPSALTAFLDNLLSHLEGWQVHSVAATILVIVIPVSVAVQRLALDLANDVISYIRRNCAAHRRREQRSREGGQAADDAVPASRRRIRRRFYLVLRAMFEQPYSVDRLVVFAHSQGSVIAIDELAHSFTQKTWCDRAVTLITFGSPISHLYQHYFPATYPPWNHTQWEELFKRVRRWVNLYRIDDFVGTRVENPEQRPSPSPTDAFYQMPIGCGGHSDYWRDPSFLTALKQLKVFEPPDGFLKVAGDSKFWGQSP